MVTKNIYRLDQLYSYRKFFYAVPKYLKLRLTTHAVVKSISPHNLTKRFKLDQYLISSKKSYSFQSQYVHTASRTHLISPLQAKNFQISTLFNSENFLILFMQSPFIMKFISKESNLVQKK